MSEVNILEAVEALEIRGAVGLDPIQVYLADVGPSRGHVTITCYGNAWTCYFGAMGGSTIREFVAMADADYLATKLGINQVLNRAKRNEVYLRKIVAAVKESLRGPSIVEEAEPEMERSRR